MFGGEDKTATASHSVPNSGLTRSNTKFNSTVDGNEHEISVMVGTLFVAHHKIIQLAMTAPHVKHVRQLRCCDRFGDSGFELPAPFPRILSSNPPHTFHFRCIHSPVAPML